MQVRLRLRHKFIDGTERVLYGKVCVGHFSSIPNDLYRATWFMDKSYPSFVGTYDECLEWFDTMALEFASNFFILGEQDANDPDVSEETPGTVSAGDRPP